MNSPTIHTIDLHFQGQANSIAAFLVESEHGYILVETGPHSTFDHLCQQLWFLGADPADIEHVLVTHIHLDHAGAAWAFAEMGARVYLHPLGYRHMHDPSKLLASAKMIYKDMMDQLWGTLKPISEENLQIVEDGESIRIDDLEFTAHHTPGHAKHHIAWQLDDAVFTGDVAGIRIHGGPIIPPCPPPDIHIEDWNNSITKLLKLSGVKTYYLTHFGPAGKVQDHMTKLRQALRTYSDFVYPYYKSGTSVDELAPDFAEFATNYLVSNGMKADDAKQYELANPSYMSVAGLLRYWKKREEKEEE